MLKNIFSTFFHLCFGHVAASAHHCECGTELLKRTRTFGSIEGDVVDPHEWLFQISSRVIPPTDLVSNSAGERVLIVRKGMISKHTPLRRPETGLSWCWCVNEIWDHSALSTPRWLPPKTQIRWARWKVVRERWWLRQMLGPLSSGLSHWRLTCKGYLNLFCTKCTK